jgi:hypothetical protein
MKDINRKTSQIITKIKNKLKTPARKSGQEKECRPGGSGV